MEELHQAAEAYYANLSEDQKALVQNFFKRLDTDGDEKVNLEEYLTFLRQKGITCITNSNFFRELDQDGDGNLNYSEFITLYYIYRSGRIVYCDGCGEFLKGLYFTCVKCFKKRGKSNFDICSSCYKNKSYSHKHKVFLDNYVVLQKLASKASGDEVLVETGLLAIDVGANIVCNLM